MTTTQERSAETTAGPAAAASSAAGWAVPGVDLPDDPAPVAPDAASGDACGLAAEPEPGGAAGAEGDAGRTPRGHRPGR